VEGKISSYKDLEVWKLGVKTAEAIFILTSSFPAEQKFGLSSQMQRAAVSIPSNIAEGYARDGTGEYIYYLSVAMGSLAELETQLLIARNINLCKPEQINGIFGNLTSLGKMLKALSLKLKSKTAKPEVNKHRILNPVS
jgi:four helix bundle protein